MSHRYQTRARSCSALLLITLLVIVVLVQWLVSRRSQPALSAQLTPPAPTATATFVSRARIAALPTNTPYLKLAPLPTFTATPSPTRTPTPTVTPTPTATLVYSARIGIELVNLRSGPGVAYEIVTVLGQDEEVFIIGKTLAGDWLTVRTTTGQEGWVAASFLDAEARLTLPVLTPPPLPSPTPTRLAQNTPAPQRAVAAAAAAAIPAPAGAARFPRRVLANYFTWFDANGWDACNISAGDRPLQTYGSDDPAAIARHVQMASGAGIDGFTAQWATPGDRTDRNFAALLAASAGTGFQSTVVFLRHIWPGASYGSTVEALRYILAQYSGHSNFLKIDGRPVLFITDVYRVPGLGGSAQETWAQIRAEVDPNRSAWWIAEGLDPSFLSVFDGLWVYKVSHAAYPNDYLKAERWASRVRNWEQQSGSAKLWVGTLMPGWDDRRAGCRPDVRVPSAPFVRDREGGAFYRATYDAAAASNPDLLWIHSFNEWVEGSYIEPSQFYGDAYLNLTRELAAKFKQ